MRALRCLTFVLAFLLGANRANACTCVIADPKTSFKQADAVFIAEVVEAFDGGAAVLRPIEVFKGSSDETISVVTSAHGAACGYGDALTLHSRHLIYASRHGYMPYLEVSSCSRTKPIERAACDLSYLRSRARWWRSSLSSLRFLARLGVRWNPCSAPAQSQ